ncbi:MAG: hypothetical protein EOO90_08710 [Pedobacter sp.]|nr:MAG: hypothetical protein EOO90_08710 [Pedobacter sp.]
MNSILKADSVNARGERKILNDNLFLLTGFSLNSLTALKDTFFIPVEPEWVESEQLIRLQLPAFLPKSVMDVPDKASLFQFHLCATMRVNDDLEGIRLQSQLFDLDTPQDVQCLDLPFGKTDTDAIVVFFAISFFNVVAGYAVPLTAPCKNALDIIKVLIKPQ